MLNFVSNFEEDIVNHVQKSDKEIRILVALKFDVFSAIL